MKNLLHCLVFAWCAWFLVACAAGSSPAPDTPLPREYLPTAVALTVEAGQQNTPRPVLPEVVTATPLPPFEPSPLPVTATPEASPNAPRATATSTAPPPLPDADIQIFRLGELSKVVSPISARVYFQRGYVGPATAELHGEDGRLLARQMKELVANPQAWADITFKIPFEIGAAAEAGRLVIRSNDAFGRPAAVNSVSLVLLSRGTNDFNASDALQKKIIIQQPAENSLVQGGKLLVAGMARTASSQMLRVQILAEDGRIVGSRLAALAEHKAGEYAQFAVEVPYTVADLTPVRLIVFEDGGQISEFLHLASVLLQLSP